MIYAKIEDELVTKILCGDVETDNTYITLPDNTDVYIGVNINEIREGYLIPLEERIEKGYVILPEPVNNNPPEIMTNEEQLEKGLITQEEYERKKIDDEVMRLKSYLDSTDWYIVRFLETGKELPLSLKEDRQKARDRISELRPITNPNFKILESTD